MANIHDEELGRRAFVTTMSVAAGVAAAGATVATAEAAVDVVEKDVDIKTADGTCDAAFFHPATGAHAAVLVWPDAGADQRAPILSLAAVQYGAQGIAQALPELRPAHTPTPRPLGPQPTDPEQRDASNCSSRW